MKLHILKYILWPRTVTLAVQVLELFAFEVTESRILDPLSLYYSVWLKLSRLYIPPDKKGVSTKYFSYCSRKTHVVGTH